MKSNLILHVQKLKKIGTIFLLVGMVCSVSVMDAVMGRSTSTSALSQPTPPIIPQTPPISQPSAPVIQQPSNVPVPAQPQSQIPTTTTAFDKQAATNWILQQPAPWSQQLYDWVQQVYPYLDSTQKKQIDKYYMQIHSQTYPVATQAQFVPLKRPSDIQLQEETVAPKESWTFEGALSGAGARAKAAAGWGMGKLGQAYEYAKDVPASLWSYESSIGGGTKTAASLGAIAAVPYLTTMAATGGTAAIIGGGVYGLTSLLDRLEYRYKTGEWSEVGAIKNLVLKLRQTLADTGKYPTISTITEALKDQNELYALDKDEFGLLTKAHTILLKMYQNADKALSEDDKQKDRAIINKVNQLRSSFGYNANNPEILKNYVVSIINNFNISEMMAVLSEYYRAMQKIYILEEKAKNEKTETPK